MSARPSQATSASWSNVADTLRSRAETRPQHVAYRFLLDGESEIVELTYAELDRRAQALAAELQTRRPAGERALLLYPPGLDFVVAFFACAYAGAVAVPAHPPRPRRPDPRARQILVDSRARFALTTEDVLSQAREIIAGRDELQDVSWIASDRSTTGADQWRPPDLRADDLLLLQYTSGSTSTPKGVMVSHGNMLSNFRDVDRVGVHDEQSVILSWLPHLHDMGLIYGILQTPFNGCTCVLMSPAAFLQRPARWLEAITRFRATHSAGPNFAYDLCVQRVQPEQHTGLDLSSWRIAWNGAEPVRAETLQRFAETFRPCGFTAAAFRPSYGLAEATLLGTAKAKRDEPLLCPVPASADESGERKIIGLSEGCDADCVVSCGHAVEGTRVAIVEPESGIECPEGTIGEIWISGPTVARGYWGRPEDTRDTFAARIAGTDGPDFLRTGDLGFVSDDELFVTGRLKDLIIIRGVNHYPQDIELTVERSHPGLRAHAAAAFAVETGNEDRLVVVQEVERVHRNPDIDAITSAIRREILEEHGIQPLAVVLVRHGSVPKTTSGKVQRFLCRNGFLDGTLRVLGEWRETEEPRGTPAESDPAATATIDAPVEVTVDDLRSWLVARIAARSGSTPADIDIDLPFSDFGLDSLQAQELIGELEQWLGRRLSPVLIWNYPSIEALATRLAEETKHDAPASTAGEKRAGT